MSGPRRGGRTVLAAVLLAVATLAGCSSSTGDTQLTVLAASSLTDAMGQAVKVYEQGHPGVKVRVSYAGSQELAAQVRSGAPADVLVTADTPTMRALGSRVGSRRVIAHNLLTIVVPRGNPGKVHSLADLARPGVTVVLAAAQVPAGRYARTVLDNAGVHVSPVSDELDVRSVLTRIRLGEADAGIVYVTDATSASGQVEQVPIPATENITATYPASVITASTHSDLAANFVQWLTTSPAQRVFESYGFLPAR